MPNHITNILTFSGDPARIKALFDAVKYTGEDAERFKDAQHTIDFNKIIPQPKDIGDGWYDWNIGNWGTKWNSYGYYTLPDYNTTTFDTAWNAPHPIIQKLSEMYPDLTIEHWWADEDIGYNCGKNVYSGGERVEEYFPDYGKAAVDFACEVKGMTQEELGYVINAAGTDYICLDFQDYQVIELCGQTALFSDERLKMRDIPDGTYVYDLRESDGGERFATLEHHVDVNHGGSVVTKEPIDFCGQDYIAFTEETAPNFTGAEATFGMFLRNEINLDEGMGGM